MSSSRRMDHMTWPEIEASKSKPVIVPIGSTEQHSQHLPLGVDAMIASHVSEDLAEQHSQHRGTDHELRVQVEAAFRRRPIVPRHHRHERCDGDQSNA